MEGIARIVFWFSLSALVYTYLLYPALLIIMVSLKKAFRRRVPPDPSFLPPVTLVISSYNEATILRQKMDNTLQINYPVSRLKIVCITDGSDDESTEILRLYPTIRHLHQPERKGKLAAMNRAVSGIDTPFVVFSDANTLLNADCLLRMMVHFADPQVGAVSGEKKVRNRSGDGEVVPEAVGPVSGGIAPRSVVPEGESLYWRYESSLKKLDSDLHTTVGAAGELWGMRTALYEQLPEDTVIEDFVQSMLICMKGFVVRYEPAAWSLEAPSLSLRDETERKVRISAGAFQAMRLLKPLYNPFRFPVVLFQLVSHRLLRWTLCPVALVTLPLSAAVLYGYTVSGKAGNSIAGSGSNGTATMAHCFTDLSFWPSFYGTVGVLALVFWAAGLVGGILTKLGRRAGPFYMPFYFLFMHLCVFAGFFRYIGKKQAATWNKAERGETL